MPGLRCLTVLWALCAGIESQNWSRNRVQQSNPQVQGNQRPPSRSWNTQMYPIWREGDRRQKDCWKGGQVTFDLSNDAPTLTGAKSTFSIQLNFPHNQTVLPDGQVVWSQNRTDNGTWVPVYNDEATEGSKCVFPDGRPFPRDAEKRRRQFVYVWQTWGKSWQVVDGPSSLLTVDTEGIPLGSYTMEVVVYHYRGRQKFIPIGSVSSQFSITDQIPVSVSISQLLDLDQDDQRFIQNRAVSFSVAVHDPSHYLQNADLSFSWDFGDQSGTLISRSPDVTHTYVSLGVFRPQVVLQAAIPISPCASTSAETIVATTVQPAGFTTDPVAGSTTGPAATTAGGQETVAPTTTAAPIPSNTTIPAATSSGIVVLTISLADEINLEAASVEPEDAAALPETVPPPSEEVTSLNEAVTSPAVVPSQAEEAVTSPAVVPSQAEEAVTSPAVVPSQTEEAVTLVAEITPGDTAAVIELAVASGAPLQTVVTELPAASTEAPPVPATGEPEGELVVLAKRQAPEGPAVGCLLYRYGTFATDLTIVQGIEAMQIVQVAPIAAAGLENAVDLTITCQGSIPSQVCTVISDPDCASPQQTVCSPVAPSSDCQLVLRQVFNDSGLYCVNVSLTDDVSLAVASTQVRVSAGAASSSINGVIAMVGVLLVAFALATVAYTYRRVKSYTPLRTHTTPVGWFPDRPSLRLFFQNALGRSLNGESSPLLNGRVV
ncbi:melanocyte protein PMEL [Ascaphus truei]|uniref:melanocyte protein PMEL n=1 Tax=Ascaphus truei TaxID=8439 RepID=UPI003F59CF13